MCLGWPDQSMDLTLWAHMHCSWIEDFKHYDAIYVKINSKQPVPYPVLWINCETVSK